MSPFSSASSIGVESAESETLPRIDQVSAPARLRSITSAKSSLIAGASVIL